MNNLRSLLQDADPLRHEAPRLDAERERIRLSILQNIAVEPPVTAMRARLKLVAALAMVAIGITAGGYELWRHATPVFAAVRFEVRLAEDQPIPGLVVARLGAGRVIYLHPEIVVSNDDIAQSWVSEDGPNQFGIAVQLLSAGAERMRQATAAHVGRPVAILIDGNVVMVPVVRSPIGDSAVITGNYTRAEAERIAEGMRVR